MSRTVLLCTARDSRSYESPNLAKTRGLKKTCGLEKARGVLRCQR